MISRQPQRQWGYRRNPWREAVISRILKTVLIALLLLPIRATFVRVAYGGTGAESRIIKEQWSVHDAFARHRPMTIAIMPMDNLTYQEKVADELYKVVYENLPRKGYQRISVQQVMAQMKRLGIQTPGQLTGISPDRLGRQLHCDAILTGQVDQCDKIHRFFYDAIVVSVSLRLIDCHSGLTLWETEQWRTAHRQWAGDPLNMLINFAVHEGSSYQKRIRYLVKEMLRTLPPGPVTVKVGTPLLSNAVVVDSEDR